MILEEETLPTTLKKLQRLFIDHFDYKIEELTAATTLENLGLDSLDIIEFMFDIENEFNIRIPERQFKVTTIQEMVDALDRFILEQDSEQDTGSSSHD
ncbi:MAG: phosphopantetheine-binding protein [Syntrophorhabdales bacterium]